MIVCDGKLEELSPPHANRLVIARDNDTGGQISDVVWPFRNAAFDSCGEV